MGTWISMLLICMLMPLSLIFIWYFCPRIKSVNSWMGYRTARSTKNSETWEFAQKSCADNSLKMFLPTAALTLIIMLFVLNKEDKVIQYVGLGITMAQLLSYGAVLYLTEKDLKKEFDDRGKRRNNI
ncbi:hypothetical protein HMPREF0380_01206 [Eubacterium infirmum F0142]|nr:hypothetical protein HMPREF0380_01206 [Eubacterium infirmum F0142]